MEVVKITPGGQLTLPIDIRRKLGIRDGDKIVFMEEQGQIIVANAAKIAFANLRSGLAGEAERLNLKDEKDITTLVNEVREQMWEERCNAGNA